MGTAILTVLFFVSIFLLDRFSNFMIKTKETHQKEIEELQLETLKKTLSLQEAERQRIAARLHDEIGPFLSVSKFNLQSFGFKLQMGKLTPAELNDQLRVYEDLASTIRSISHEISPVVLEKTGLDASIEKFLNSNSAIKTTYTNTLTQQGIGKENEILLYRTILELLNNIIKHDTPEILDIVVEKENNLYVLKIRHNGKGINNEDFKTFAANSTGMGMNNIQSNLILLQASMELSKKLDKVIIRVPLSESSAPQ